MQIADLNRYVWQNDMDVDIARYYYYRSCLYSYFSFLFTRKSPLFPVKAGQVAQKHISSACRGAHSLDTKVKTTSAPHTREFICSSSQNSVSDEAETISARLSFFCF